MLSHISELLLSRAFAFDFHVALLTICGSTEVTVNQLIMNFKPFKPPLLLGKVTSDTPRKGRVDGELPPAKKRRVSNEDRDSHARIGKGSQNVNNHRHPLVPLKNIALSSEHNSRAVAPNENCYTVLW